LITPQTRAIVVVHYAGVGCEMDAIMEIANRHNIPVIEDNAHGLFGKYKGKDLGTFGVMATQSFHETKNLTSGEGGALLINDEKYFEDAEVLREKGTNRSRFFRGQVDKYTWVNLGSSYLPSEILAAHLLAQLESARRFNPREKRFGKRITKNSAHGRRRTTCKCRSSPRIASRPITCSTCSSPTSKRGRKPSPT
jgi:dTDP-4-amino-4,6-dideoxygalactose transaminase